MRIALKVDVDTLRGSREGALRLAEILRRRGAQATFLFSLGPDHTGRSVFRMFRPELLRKVRRTSVVRHYGIRTLLYGTLLPGPDIGRRAAAEFLQIERAGFEVGVHAWDHVAWHNRVARAGRAWTRLQMQRACERFTEIFKRPPIVQGAAGWQMNAEAFAFEHELGIHYASDTRGTAPFLPQLKDGRKGVPQLPTTLPTFDELLGREGWNATNLHEAVLRETGKAADHVFTLHAELEGGMLAPAFERLLDAWRAAGAQLLSLGEYAQSLDLQHLPPAAVEQGRIAGRAGRLAVQRV